jgi:hypothetical protein
MQIGKKGNAPGVSALLRHGADPLLPDSVGRLALHYVRVGWTRRPGCDALACCSSLLLLLLLLLLLSLSACVRL